MAVGQHDNQVPNYNWQPTRDYCASIGLGVDEPWFPLANAEAQKYGLTQDQFDAAMRLHAWHVKSLFDRKRYSFAARLGIAAYFIFGLGAKS